MYTILKIGNQDYKIEYSIEASLYSECTEKMVAFLADTADATEEGMASRIRSISNLPQTTLTMLYAGLLEHHGTEVGDGLVKSIADAKFLASQYLKENVGKEDGNWYGLFQKLMVQMGEDNFFEIIGLAEMIGLEVQPNKKVQPQDHKKKQTTKKTAELEVVTENK